MEKAVLNFMAKDVSISFFLVVWQPFKTGPSYSRATASACLPYALFEPFLFRDVSRPSPSKHKTLILIGFWEDELIF